MAGLWCSLRHRRENGDRDQSHPHVVHVHFPAYAGLSHRVLYDPCFLDEYETVHTRRPAKPPQVFVTFIETQSCKP